ncbi:MAG: hypothetical protein GF411_20375, partial [Candidatus Lokiarchaeota archaeon]|nr:hypothetical protein [Candidatus Lokiarchaeota archaeon]
MMYDDNSTTPNAVKERSYLFSSIHTLRDKLESEAYQQVEIPVNIVSDGSVQKAKMPRFLYRGQTMAFGSDSRRLEHSRKLNQDDIANGVIYP